MSGGTSGSRRRPRLGASSVSPSACVLASASVSPSPAAAAAAAPFLRELRVRRPAGAASSSAAESRWSAASGAASSTLSVGWMARRRLRGAWGERAAAACRAGCSGVTGIELATAAAAAAFWPALRPIAVRAGGVAARGSGAVLSLLRVRQGRRRHDSGERRGATQTIRRG